MKLSTRNLLKMLRLYGLADDNSSVKSMRSLVIDPKESYVKASLVFQKRRFCVLYGSSVDEESVAELWPELADKARTLANPLDASTTVTPFHGKYLIILEIPSGKTRLDILLTEAIDPSITRSQWQKYVKAGCVKVDGQTATSPGLEVEDTAHIEVDFPKKIRSDHSLEVIYQDEDVVVVDKPSGMLTHAKGGIVDETTVADFAKSIVSEISDSDRPGIVHRLDRDTSGLLIIAKNNQSAKHLQEQFATRKVKKTYIAVVDGAPKIDHAEIDLPIGRNPAKPSTFRVDPKGKAATTIYRVLSTEDKKSLVELSPITGRTHQLRVHMAYIGTPIVGDVVYGKADDRLMLHAHKLGLTLPSGLKKEFVSPLPKEFTDI